MKAFYRKTIAILLAVLLIVPLFPLREDLPSGRVAASAESVHTQYVPAGKLCVGRKTFALYNYAVSWANAKQICETLGGHLAAPLSQSEHTATVSLLDQYASASFIGYWLGATDEAEEGTFCWITGETPEQTFWSSGEPNGGTSENCVELKKSTKLWNDSNGNAANRGFICEFEDYFIPIEVTDFEGHYYLAFHESCSWQEAKALCEKMGGHLVTIASKDENDAITDLVRNQLKGLYWIGLSSPGKDGNWEWVTGEPIYYSNWAPGEPSGGAEWCVQLFGTDYSAGNKTAGQWNDSQESSTSSNFYAQSNIGFICEVEPKAVRASAYDLEVEYFTPYLYKLYDVAVSYPVAKAIADYNQETLLTTGNRSQDIRFALSELYRKLGASADSNARYWIGAQKLPGASDFTWNGEEAIGEYYWADGEPSTAGCDRFFVQTTLSNKWYAAPTMGENMQCAGFITRTRWEKRAVGFYNLQHEYLGHYYYEVAKQCFNDPPELKKPGYDMIYYLFPDLDAPDDELIPFDKTKDEDRFSKPHCFAVDWVPKQYILSFNPCGGVVSESQKTVLFEREYGQLPSAQKVGYTFAGWFTAPEDGDAVTSRTLLTSPENQTVYARWTPNAYTVLFDAAGGNALQGESLRSRTLDYGSSYGALPRVEKEGFRFLGWYLKDTDTLITECSLMSLAYDHTLKARWTEQTAVSAEVVSLPEKTVYAVGESFDPAGLTLSVSYDNGKTQIVSSGFTFSSDPFFVTGKTTVQIEYQGVYVQLDITVNHGATERIEIKKLPHKTVYQIGETIDSDGMELYAYYPDGTVETVIEGFGVSVVYFSKPGKYQEMVSYQGCLATFYVTVVAAAPVSLSVTKQPTKLKYLLNENFDPTGMELTVDYANGSRRVITSGYQVSFDSTSAGTISVTVFYEENGVTVSCAFPVEVLSTPEVILKNNGIDERGHLILSVDISGNTGLMGFSLLISYPEDLLFPELVSPGELLQNEMLNDNIGTAHSNPLQVVFTGNAEITGNGTLFTVDFGVLNDSQASAEVLLSYVPLDTFNEDYRSVVLFCRSVTVDLQSSSCTVFFSEPVDVFKNSLISIPVSVKNYSPASEICLHLAYDPDEFVFFGIHAGAIQRGGEWIAESDDDGLSLRLSEPELIGDGELCTVVLKTGQSVSSSSIHLTAKVSRDGEENECVCKDIPLKYGAAAAKAKLISQTVSLTQGDASFTIPVSIAENPGIMGFRIYVDYDATQFEAAAVSKGELLRGKTLNDTIGTGADRMSVLFSGVENVFGDGALFYVDFSVKGEIPVGKYTIYLTCEPEDTFNEEGLDVLLQAAEVTITVAAPHVHAFTVLKSDESYHWYECAYGCGTISGKTAHFGGTATCTEKANCAVCGTAYGEPLGHSFTILKTDGESTWYECANGCGEILLVGTLRGDMNGDGYVDSDDAIYLLYHTLLPDSYPINQNGDMNADGYVDSDDAIYLLYYTLLPDSYPLH